MSTDQPQPDRPPWDQPSVGPPGMQEPPQKKGLSCGALVLIGVAILGGLGILVCCGGFMAAGFYFKDAVSEDPQVIAEVTDEIAQIEIPEGLAPQASFKMKIPFTDEHLMTWVVYADEPTQSALVLGAFGGPMAEMDQDELREGMEQSMREQGVRHEENVEELERYEKTIPVRGEPVTFYFVTGQDDSGKPRLQVNGVFQGDDGPMMFVFSGDAEKYGEAQIVKAIESIR